MAAENKRRFVTQADVAREANTSRALVSLALSGSPKVSDKTRERITAAAEKLGYITSSISQSISGGRSSKLIGYLAQSLSNPLFTEIYRGLSEVMGGHGHQVVVMEGSSDPEVEDVGLRNLVSLRPDAVVLGGYTSASNSLKAAVRTIPVASVTREIDVKNVDNFVGDDFRGAYEATQTLIDMGHTRIGHIQFPPEIPYERRAQAYVQATDDANLPNMLISAPLSASGGYDAVRRLIDQGQLPTALFCANDVLALGALDAARDFGLQIPRDLSIIGYDNTEVAVRAHLSSVDQHARDMGIAAGKMMLDRLNGDVSGPGETWVQEPKLILRESSGLAPNIETWR